MQMPMEMVDRYRGALLGLACGDAVGTTVEFMPRGSFVPVQDMMGGGPFSLDAGKWTDDTSMALCLAESLIQTGRCDPADQMTRYANWYTWGYWSSTGNCFDIGLTTKGAIQQFLLTGDPLSGPTDPEAAGNGSLMRLAPIALRYGHDEALVQDMAALSSRTTHAAAECLDACRVFAVALSRALRGLPKAAILDLTDLSIQSAKIQSVVASDHASKSLEQIRGSGYVVESLEAALWCYAKHDTYRGAVLEAVNLGDDADTTAAIVGQLAGAAYGAAGIPECVGACILQMRSPTLLMPCGDLRRNTQRWRTPDAFCGARNERRAPLGTSSSPNEQLSCRLSIHSNASPARPPIQGQNHLHAVRRGRPVSRRHRHWRRRAGRRRSIGRKVRQAYFWIVNNAIISPHYDIEFNDGPTHAFKVGDGHRTLTLPSAQSYSSFILLPQLTFATRRKCLLVGGPEPGRTVSAILMGVQRNVSMRLRHRLWKFKVQSAVSISCAPMLVG